eukprot:scaffold19220_cov180-Amphora_coffeaeformis.AAC.4
MVSFPLSPRSGMHQTLRQFHQSVHVLYTRSSHCPLLVFLHPKVYLSHNLDKFFARQGRQVLMQYLYHSRVARIGQKGRKVRSRGRRLVVVVVVVAFSVPTCPQDTRHSGKSRGGGCNHNQCKAVFTFAVVSIVWHPRDQSKWRGSYHGTIYEK